ncbi:MAG: L-arabinose isomerase family protein [Spirochaetota bacterium]
MKYLNYPGNPVVGILPLMLEMYKKYSPEMARKQEPFLKEIKDRVGKFSRVEAAPVCSNNKQTRKAVVELEQKGVDLLVVVFISYAASISVIQSLIRTPLPILLFSTSPRSSMAGGMTMEDIMLNHGVHGYMDLANVLKRSRRQYFFVAGAMNDRRTFQEVEAWARTARAKKLMEDSVVGIAGHTFDGMGDFGVDTTLLHTVLGPRVKHVPLDVVAEAISGVGDKEIEMEIDRDRKNYYIAPDVDQEIHSVSNRTYLGLKKVINDMGIHAFTMHFQGMLEHPGISTPPFLGISKLQEQGLAYAGEGDLVGAAGNLIARLLCGQVMFSETFCPDFDGGRIVMAHMGESNPALGKETVLRRKKFAFGEAVDPVVADVEMKAGTATVLNLGVVEENSFQVVVYTGEICEKIPASDDVDMPYFHFKPHLSLNELLARYGYAGGTHHVSVIQGNRRDDLLKLAQMMEIRAVVLE